MLSIAGEATLPNEPIMEDYVQDDYDQGGGEGFFDDGGGFEDMGGGFDMDMGGGDFGGFDMDF